MTPGRRGLALVLVVAGCAPHADPIPLHELSAVDQGRARAWPGARSQPEVMVSTGPDLAAVANEGSAPVGLAEAAASGGSVGIAPGPSGGASWTFPDVADGRSPAAVLVVSNRGSRKDRLAPGSGPFVYGALFSLDVPRPPDPTDDGDSLLRRGPSSTGQHYAMEIDGGRVSCVVRGDASRVSAVSSLPLRPGRWYRASCARDADGLQVRVAEATDRSEHLRVDTTVDTVGSVGFDDLSAPVVIGGRLGADGSPARSASDQLDGRIASFFYANRTVSQLGMGP